ncbi:hypothetical protein JNW90_12065 [Micromonospora sp. STR1s_5]|nr:hypothetical protein [Micromonospora sp. STR1s_5]
MIRMIFLVVGLPVRRVRRTIDSVVSALAAAGVEADIVEADDLSQFAAHAISSRAAPSIVWVRHVGHDWARVLSTSNVPFAYLHTHPVRALADQDDLLVAARDAIMRLVSFIELRDNPNCLSLNIDDSTAVQHLVDAVADRFGTPNSLPPQEKGLLETEIDLSTFGGEVGATARAALRGFEPLSAGNSPKSILISRLMFSDATRGGIPVHLPIDVTGRPRILFYGPFIHLPRGVWRARIVASFSEQLVGQTFELDVVAGMTGERLAHTTFTLEVPSRRDMLLEFRHQDYTAVLQVRLSSQRGVFDGAVSLGYVEFTVAEPDTDTTLAPPL